MDAGAPWAQCWRMTAPRPFRYKLLGHSGPRVSEARRGTMIFGEDWGFGSGKEEC